MKRIYSLAAAAAMAMTALGSAQAQTVYNAPSLADFSGPFASIMPSFSGGREATINWWNTEVGSKLKIKIAVQSYDTRYDTAQSASLWPGVLATKPLIGFALGGPDTAALQQRLPNDKVVMLLASASNGFGWRPNQWVLSTRPTFVHELVGFIEWAQRTQAGGTRPIKVAMFTSEASPSFADMGRGVSAYAKAHPKIVDLVEMVYAEPQPADLTLQLRRVLNAGAEYVLAPASPQQAIALRRAMNALGKKVPIVYSMHNSPSQLDKAMGGIAVFEGDYEVQSGAIASADDNEPHRFYDMLVAKYGLKAPWNSLTAAGIGQALLLVRSVEAAAKKYGPSQLTGEQMYKVILETPFTSKELFGYMNDLSYGVGAPFPTYNIKVNVAQVKGGKMLLVTSGSPVSKLERW